MPNVCCKICNAEFYIKPFHYKKGWGKYCSRKCQHIGQRTGQFLPCAICGNKVWRYRKEIKKSETHSFFCTKSCQTIWRNKRYSGPKHASWTNGIGSYRQILLRSELPKFCHLCGTLDFRILAVHHIDKNRTNNILSNLIWLCHNCHYLIHHDALEMKKFMQDLKRRPD